VRKPLKEAGRMTTHPSDFEFCSLKRTPGLSPAQRRDRSMSCGGAGRVDSPVTSERSSVALARQRGTAGRRMGAIMRRFASTLRPRSRRAEAKRI
jgi:hypothetical protein